MSGMADPVHQLLDALDHVAASLDRLRIDLARIEGKMLAVAEMPDRKRHRTEYMRLYMRRKRAQQGKAHNGERNGTLVHPAARAGECSG